MKPTAGVIVASKYRLVRELGEGSQGRVWVAEHTQMGTPLALKILDPHLAAKQDYLRRFKREARAAATIRSANVVQVFDFDVWEGCPYIAMELLEGIDLGVKLERVGKLPVSEVSQIVSQVARALQRAHRKKIIHRDLKPDNIFLVKPEDEEEQVVKILDFGVAKAPMSDSLAMTGTGIVLGTPYYMSPEQAQGESGVNFRTDLWALGVITFEALVGKRPFEASNLGDLLVKICTSDTPVPSKIDAGVPRGFDEWFAQACAKDPAKRFSSAKEQAAALHIIAGKSPGSMLESSLVDIPVIERHESAREVYDDLSSAETEVVPPPQTIREPEPPQMDIAIDEGDPEENEPTELMQDVPEAVARGGRWGEEPVSKIDELTSDDIATAPTLQDQPRGNNVGEIITQSTSDGDEVHRFTAAQIQEAMAQEKKAQAQSNSHASELAHGRGGYKKWLKLLVPIIGGALFGIAFVVVLYIFVR